MALKVSQSDYFRQNSIHLLSTVLTRLIDINDQCEQGTQTTRFHSVSVPDIPLQKYLKRIARYTDCNIETLVCSVMYVLRVSRRSDLMITSLNVHRLLITSVVVAMKYIEDECFTNRYMAKVGGVSLNELNRLEISFLKRLEFNLHIAPENFEQFCTEICRLDAQIMMEEISARLPAAPISSPPKAPMKSLANKIEGRRKDLPRNCSTENMEVVPKAPMQPIC